MPSAVARPVSKRELEANEQAQEAVANEWKRLEKITTWEINTVRPWAEVAKEAKAKQRIDPEHRVHIGRVFCILVEKNAELPSGNPLRKFKGRVVFQGNQVRDQNWDIAIFQELKMVHMIIQN